MSFLDQLKKLLEDPDFIQRSKDHFKIKFERKETNKKRISKFFSDDVSFGELILKIISKHDDRWTDLCHKKSVEPYPWNILYSVCDIVEEEGNEVEPLDGLTENFPSTLLEYRGWIFAWTYGQGTCLSIYDKNKELIYRN